MPSPQDFIDSILQVMAPQTDCQIQRPDPARAVITCSPSAEFMEVDFFVHRNGGFSATRYMPGMELAASDRPHAWVTLRDVEHNTLHHEVLCDLKRFASLVNEWRAPALAAPASITLKPIAARARQPWPEGQNPSISQNLDLGLLQALPDTEQAQAQLLADVEALDAQRLLQAWPRDERGRLAARTTAVLAAYGPATRKRQPCLLIRSAMQSQMPHWELILSQEFLYNHRHQWSDAPWLWRHAQAVEPPARTLALMQQGKISQACALHDVTLGESLRHLAAGQPFQRFMPVPQDWVQELQSALLQLAPWQLQAGLERIQQHLDAANRKPAKPGSWERKLFWFSGQRQQVKWGLGISQGPCGKPLLDLIATASNEHFPEPDWKHLD